MILMSSLCCNWLLRILDKRTEKKKKPFLKYPFGEKYGEIPFFKVHLIETKING